MASFGIAQGSRLRPWSKMGISKGLQKSAERAVQQGQGVKPNCAVQCDAALKSGPLIP